jgi:hypothetical protein
MAKTIDWRTLVGSEGSDGSVYQADTYCGGCTDQICKELDKAGKKPEEVEDEASFDSDEYPKRVDLESDESDSPSHCGSNEECVNAIKLPCGSKIGAWLGTNLTDEGVKYTSEAIREDLTRDDVHARQVGRLWRKLYEDQLGDYEKLEEIDEKAVKVKVPGFKPMTSMAWTDLDFIYVVGRTKGGVDLIRFEIGSKGDVESSEVVETDESLWKNENPLDVIGRLADDREWW